MLEKLFGGLTLAEQSVPNGFVIALGIGVVFLGLICIVVICQLMSAILAPKTKKAETTEPVAATTAPEATAVIENRQEIIAAVSAVIAEELGTDISALRVHSFKKI